MNETKPNMNKITSRPLVVSKERESSRSRPNKHSLNNNYFKTVHSSLINCVFVMSIMHLTILFNKSRSCYNVITYIHKIVTTYCDKKFISRNMKILNVLNLCTEIIDKKMRLY